MEKELPSFIALIEESIKKNWDKDAFTDYKSRTLQYKDVARKVEKLHILFENSGIKPGDKIALCGRNSAHWASAFIATLTYGAVAVPILHEFKAEQVHHIVNHSEARILFVGDVIWPTLDPEAMPNVEGIIYIPDYSLKVSRNEQLSNARETLNLQYGKKYPKYFRQEHISYVKDDLESMALINYTSGSTGNSKGVMIPYRALASNMQFAEGALKVKDGDCVISILPMAHMYGMAFEFLYEFIAGVHIYFLTRLPSPKIILQAFAEIKPAFIISVPLILEKVVRKQVWPKVNTPAMRLLMKTPYIGDRVREKICKQMKQAFGGNFYETIIGGAALSRDVEMFLQDIKFPYTVGYGTTECAPILSYEDWKKFKPGSCGKAAMNMQLRIESEDPQHVVGEILAKGPNVMLGYYKNPEATNAVLDKDGWYRTGDLGTIDANGNLTIKGRSKNMLLGSSGQNIYPEEIEDKLNSMPLVVESVVVQRGEKLVGLVYVDPEDSAVKSMNASLIAHQMEENRKALNAQVPAYEQLTSIEVRYEEFEKTPKKSIKRFLYL
ncbi:MAG: AMP-binding protein [Bacteroidaceae bacterium]|nr:AMP-binding protein [Bacteroidaceae bacterium]